MGQNERGVRDGTGPYKDSFRKIGEQKDIGRRQDAGEKCPRQEQPAQNQNQKQK